MSAVLLPFRTQQGQATEMLEISQKNIFLANQRGVQSGDSVAFLHEGVFLIDRVSCLAREDSMKKDSAKLRKSHAVTRAQVYNVRRSIFTADLSKVYRKICIAVRDFYTVVSACKA